MSLTVFGDAKDIQVQKIVCAAAYDTSRKVAVKPLAQAKPCEACPFSSPCFFDGKQNLCGSSAIMWEVGGEKMRGQTPDLHSQVICWLSYCDRELRNVCMSYVLYATSCINLDKKSADNAREGTHSILHNLNEYLLPRTFLVGERISAADISVALDLWPLFEHVLDASAVAKYQNLTRWFMTIVRQPNVHRVIGDVKFCERPAAHDAKKLKENESKLKAVQGGSAQGARAKTASESSGKGKKDKKGKHDKPKAEPKKKEKDQEPEEEMDETELIRAAEDKKKDPFADFPKGTLNMDEFKRVYSNEDTVTKAIPYFWDHFDKENYSLWYCEYKYPQELSLVFMSANLMGGMLQRLDKMRKNAFGSLCLFGTDNNSSISGIWFWRGHELAFKLSDDWQIDYESYEWKKLNPDDPATKKMVNEYLAWEGDFDGKKFNQGKIFK